MPSATPPETERSPSPPASAPTALTPGYRAEAFVTLYKAALDKTLEAISPSSFGACFPSISTNAPTQLAAMHTGMTAGLRSFALAEFDTIMEERRVVENLNRLEDLISDAKKRKARSTSGTDGDEQPVPPHTLPPKPLVNAHLNPIHRSQQSQLNARLQTTQSQNANLIEVLRRQKAEIEELVKLAERVVGDVGDAGGRLGGEGEGLADGARRAEESLGSV